MQKYLQSWAWFGRAVEWRRRANTASATGSKLGPVTGIERARESDEIAEPPSGAATEKQRSPRSGSSLQSLEFSAALVLTGVIILLHIVRLVDAGGLWRDEAAIAQLATLPSLMGIIHNFPHEAFPPLFPIGVRGVAWLANNSDQGFRVYGFLVGLSITGAIWFTVWTVRGRVPLLALALLGFNASFIQWTDSLRGYGIGTFFIILTVGLVWRAAERPGRWRLGWAALSATGSVQMLLHNPMLIFAICASAAAVATWRGSIRRGGAVVGVGLIAGLSLLPFAGILCGGREWDTLVRTDISFGSLFFKLCHALSASGWSNAWLWGLSVIAALSFACRCLVRGGVPISESDKRFLAFSVLALALGVVGYFSFLRILSYPTLDWYYLALMGFAAVLVDCMLATPQAGGVRKSRLALALLIGMTSLPLSWTKAQVRQTNVDAIARKLQRDAVAGDFIVVCPWYNGISFARYYNGTPAWMTVPAIGFHKFHRFDLIQAEMASQDQSQPIRPVLKNIDEALQQGHRVWVVGSLLGPITTGGAAPEVSAREGKRLEEFYAFQRSWSLKVQAHLLSRARRVSDVRMRTSAPISRFEDLPVRVFEGWWPNPGLATQQEHS